MLVYLHDDNRFQLSSASPASWTCNEGKDPKMDQTRQLVDSLVSMRRAFNGKCRVAPFGSVCEGSGIKGVVATSGLVVRCCFSALQLLAFSEFNPRSNSQFFLRPWLLPERQTSDGYHQHQMEQMEMAGKLVEVSKIVEGENLWWSAFEFLLAGSRREKKGCSWEGTLYSMWVGRREGMHRQLAAGLFLLCDSSN